MLFQMLSLPRLRSCLLGMFATVWLTSNAHSQNPKTVVRVAQVDWCPQICVDHEQPGYIIEILEEAFLGSEFTFAYNTYSWARGISHTTNGETVALLAAAPKETPNLIFPDAPIGEQQACFFTLPTSNWLYSGENTLAGIGIGIPINISLEELDTYRENNPDQFHQQASTPRYIERSVKMLERKRVDTFIFFKNTVLHHMAQNDMVKHIRNAGCVTATPVYMVFSPAPHLKELGQQVMRHYERRYSILKGSGRIADIMARYGLSDWSLDD